MELDARTDVVFLRSEFPLLMLHTESRFFVVGAASDLLALVEAVSFK